MRRILAAAVALAPLSMACAAFAQTTISNNQTGPIVVPSAGLTVDSGGLVTPGTSSTPTNCLSTTTTCYVGVLQNVPSVVSNSGTIGNTQLSTSGNAVGVLVQASTPGTTLIGSATQGSLTNASTIELTSTFTSPYNSSTGITYGAWTNTTNNAGIRLIPGSTSGAYFAGYIENASGATITVSGTNSYGISVEAPIDASAGTLTQSTISVFNPSTQTLGDGTLTNGTPRAIAIENAGTITVTGDNSVGLNISGAVKGDVLMQGTISASGAGAVGIQTSAPITGRVTIGGSVAATGFHYTTRPADQTIYNFLTQPGYVPQTTAPYGQTNNSEFYIGGPAVSIGGSVSGGILLDVAPTTATTTPNVGGVTDVDGDGIPDSNQTTGSIASYGSAPALQIGSTTGSITIGVVGTSDIGATTSTGPNTSVVNSPTLATDSSGNPIYQFSMTGATTQLTSAQLYDYALVLKGVISASGVYDQINATAVNLFAGTGPNPTQTTTLSGGIMLDGGTISASSYNATATAINIGAGVSLPATSLSLPAGVTIPNTSGSAGGINNAGGSIEATVLTSTVTPLPTGTTGVAANLTVPANASGTVVQNAQIAAEQLQQAVAINIAAGANVPQITNSISYLAAGGVISAEVAGGYGNAIAIQDKSGTLGTINNNGQILAVVDTTPGTTPQDEFPQAHYTSGLAAGNGICQTGLGGCAIAIDARGTATSGGLVINQALSAVAGASSSNVTITGDIYLPNAGTSGIAGQPGVTVSQSALNIYAGSVVGTLQLGTGSVDINVYGGATVRGPIFADTDTAAGAAVNINVAYGTLDDGVISTSSPVPRMLNIASLTVGTATTNGILYVTVDPLHGDTGSVLSGYNGLDVSGAATLNPYKAATTTTSAAGASLGINFANLVPVTPANQSQPNSVVMNLITANSLTGGANVDETLIINPILFHVAVGEGVTAGCATANSICVTATQATARQLGMNKAQASVYGGVYAALSNGQSSDSGDVGLRDLFLSETATTSATPNGTQNFYRDYNQLIPVSAGASLLSIQNGLEAANRALDDNRPLAQPGETTGWVQEIDYYTDKNGVNAQGFRAHGAGFAAGLERGTPVGAFGLSTTFSTGDMKSPDQLGTSDLASVLYEVGGYWRFEHNGWRAWSRFGAGYVTFNSNREFIDNPVVPAEITTTTPVYTTNSAGVSTVTGVSTSSTPAAVLTRTATANYSGYTATAAAGVSYEQHFWRRYFVRPEAMIEYLYLHEDGYTEENATANLTTNGILLSADAQSSHILTTRALLNFGARYGDQGQNGFTAEFHVGYQDNINADPGVSVVRYLSDPTATKYAIAADSLTGGGPVAGFRLMAGGPMGYIALEGDVEDMDQYMTYMIMLRAAFRF
jgi:hypothetical protein